MAADHTLVAGELSPPETRCARSPQHGRLSQHSRAFTTRGVQTKGVIRSQKMETSATTSTTPPWSGRWRPGDRRAVAALYARHAPLLLGLALRIVRERCEAEDLLHDVFLEAWRAAKDFDPARGRVRTWLAIRMRSRALDHQKSARVSRNAGDAGLDVIVDEGAAPAPTVAASCAGPRGRRGARRRPAPGRRARVLRGPVVLRDRGPDRHADRDREVAARGGADPAASRARRRGPVMTDIRSCCRCTRSACSRATRPRWSSVRSPADPALAAALATYEDAA